MTATATVPPNTSNLSNPTQSLLMELETVNYDDSVYVKLSDLCNRLSLNTDHQKNILTARYPTLLTWINTKCYFDVDYLAEWLFNLDITRVKDEARVKIADWRNKLMSYFKGLSNTSVDGTIIPLLSNPNTLSDGVCLLLTKVARFDADGVERKLKVSVQKIQDSENKINKQYQKCMDLVDRVKKLESTETFVAMKTELNEKCTRIDGVVNNIARSFNDEINRQTAHKVATTLRLDRLTTQLDAVLSSLGSAPRRSHPFTATNITKSDVTSFVQFIGSQNLIPSYGNPSLRYATFYRLMYRSSLGTLPERGEDNENRIDALDNNQLLACYNWLYDYVQQTTIALVRQETQNTGAA